MQNQVKIGIKLENRVELKIKKPSDGLISKAFGDLFVGNAVYDRII